MPFVSVTSTAFILSSYLPFDKAVSLEQTNSPVIPETIVEVAQAYRNAKGQNPEHVIIQDLRGNFVQDSK
jgi:hypothetical protein